MQRADNVSVICTNFNKEISQIEECVQSILDQTVLPGEIIFVDDCSTERPTHKDCTSIVLDKNYGVCHARDMGVRMSKGSLLLFVDADDKLAPDFIEQCGLVIKTADIVYPDLLLFGQVRQNQRVSNPQKLKATDLLAHKMSIPVTSMMRRGVYESLRGFRNLPIFEDWDFWIRAMAEGFRFKRANTLLYYRQQEGSRIRQDSDTKQQVHTAITKDYCVREGRICKKAQ